MSTQWENFLKNMGEWRGSFTQLSLQGEVLRDTPSILQLTEVEPGTVRLWLRRFGNGGTDTPPTQDYQEDYRTLGRQLVFFETGAFSKGSLLLSPISEFGAEYGFVAPNRRSRLVQLYDLAGNFASLTLIRECRNGTDATEQPPLTVDQLLGVWQGEATTVEADWPTPKTEATQLEVRQISDQQIEQRLSFGDRQLVSQARIIGQCLQFESGSAPRQVTLLPDGASSNVPVQLLRGQPFFVEAGWLVTPTERQRLIRSYNAKGDWTGATHVIEHKVASRE
jgi:hypothetical protein